MVHNLVFWVGTCFIFAHARELNRLLHGAQNDAPVRFFPHGHVGSQTKQFVRKIQIRAFDVFCTLRIAGI